MQELRAPNWLLTDKVTKTKDAEEQAGGSLLAAAAAAL